MIHHEYSGKTLSIRYSGGIQGEDPFDECQDTPDRIVLGAGHVPRGIEEALYGMEPGETRRVVIPPEKGYGEHDPEGVVSYARSFLAEGDDLHCGDLVAWEHPVSGKIVPVKVIEETDTTVVIDFNHPLAGKTLLYELELVEVAS